MAKKTIKLKILIIFLLIANALTFAQDDQNRNPGKLFNLTQSPELTDENKVILIISELISYGNIFKYHNELLIGDYLIERKGKEYLLKILEKQKKISNKTIFKDILVLAKVDSEKRYREGKITPYQDFYIKEVEKYLNINFSNLNGEEDALPFPRYDLIYRDKALVDKVILNGVVNSGQSHILNRERARAFLRHNGQPASIYGDITDGVIIPDGNGVNGKVFTVDRMWNRIIYTNKDYSPVIGSDLFADHGYEGTGVGEFKDPTGIDYGHMYGAYRTLYVADHGNNRIQDFGYLLNYNHYWEDRNFLTNLVEPYDLSYHTGQYPENISSTDNNLWFSQIGWLRNINCASISSKSIIYNFNSFKLGSIVYPINPGRLDTYVEYQDNTAIRSMLAFVDNTLNAVIFIHLNSNGSLPINPVPEAFYGLKLPGNETITSVKFVTHLPGSIDPVGALVSSNDANGNGHLHFYKIKFLPGPGNYTTPYSVEYLASTYKTKLGSGFSENFKFLNNLDVQNNYIDIFTSESWSDAKGLRHSKMGVDIISYSEDEMYCRSTGMNVNIKVTNPVRVRLETSHKCPGTEFQPYTSTVNGLILSNGEFHLAAGANNIRIKVNHPNCSTNNPAPSENVLIKMYMLPMDETNNNSLNREYKEIYRTVNDCNGSGGCPYVYVYDGNDYVQDNNILHRSELQENVGVDIVDKYLLQVPPFIDSTDNTINLKIKELNEDYSYFDQVKLIAIDHPSSTKIGVTESNGIVLFYPDIFNSPSYAENDGEDVTEDLGYDTTLAGDGIGGGDTSETKGEYGGEGGEDDSGFKRAIKRFSDFISGLFSSESKQESKKAILLRDNFGMDSVAVILDPQQPSDALIVSSKAEWDGYLNAFDTENDYASPQIPFKRRQNKSDVIVPVGANIFVDTLGIDWNTDYSMSYLATNEIFYSGFNEYELELIEAENTAIGDVLSSLVAKDEGYAELDNNGEIILKFQGRDTLPPDGWERKYLFIVDGHYLTQGDRIVNTENTVNNIPFVYKLHQNFPNPFNPSTTIKFDLPKDGLTNIIVYDILGREVFKNNTFYNAGYNEIRFDGSKLASGVYFYMIKVGDFKDVKRMMLIK